MQLDSTHNRLECLTKQSQIIIFVLSTKNPIISEPIVYIKSKVESKEDEPFKINQMVWIKRRSALMSDTFFEGQLKGNLFLRDLNHERELKIPNDFTDKIKCIHYDGNKNLLFVSCKDGRLKCWKLPNTWQNTLMD